MLTTSHITKSQLKYYQKLSQKKFRQAERKFLIEGVHLVEEALQSDWTVEVVLMSDEFLEKAEAERLTSSLRRDNFRAEGKRTQIIQIGERELEKLSSAVTAQGIVALVKMKEEAGNEIWKALPEKSVMVALDSVSDPGNAGTILRTCDWFGVNAVFLSKDSADLYNPKVLRSTMGALFHLPIVAEVDLHSAFQTARREGYQLIVTSVANGTALDSFTFPERSLIVFGNEARGVSGNLLREANGMVTIPRYGKAESLNVAIACGIVLSRARSGF